MHRYISKNLQLYELRHEGTKLSTKAQANFCRNELAVALRKGPYQVSALLGGYDVTTGTPSLYYLDYMGTLQKIPFGAQGYSQYFTLSTMDREYREGLDEAAAIDIIGKSIHELQSRLVIKQSNYIIKVIDKDGVRVHSQGADPADT